MSFSVRVPASSANLGPGFDSLAVALSIYMHLEVDPRAEQSLPETPIDLLGGDDLVALGMQRMADEWGRELPACRVVASSDIPVARGMGSSSAALVAGLQAGAMLVGETAMAAADLIAIGGAIEGHADNVSAAVLGGVTAATGTDDGFVAARIAPDLPWRTVLFVPDAAAFTHQARGVLPAEVPLGDASANIGRTALLVQAIRDGDPTLVGYAMEDRLHQPYRAKLFPHLEPVIRAARRAGAVGACLSGAGPTVLALVPEGQVGDVTLAIEGAARDADVSGAVQAPAVDRSGVQVSGAAGPSR